MDRTRQKLNKGYADTLSRGFEFALVPVVFGGLGWLVDRALGTSPVAVVAFVVFGFVGMTVKMWLGYEAEMSSQETGAIWNRGRSGPAPSDGIK